MLTVIGEALIDEVVRDGAEPVPHVGGSPLNVAVGLARLGHPVQFLGRFGADHYGPLVSAHLHNNSVLVPLAPDEKPTSIARAVVDPDGTATYEFSLDWELPGNVQDADFLFPSTTLVHTGSIASMLQPGAGQVLKMVQQVHPRATVSFDPNCRPSIVGDVEYARAQAEAFVRLADVVKASDEDLQWLYPGQDPLDSARSWLAGGTPASGPAVVVVTRGASGPWAVCASGETSAPAVPVDVADTVGAGDSFMAALLSALVDRELDGAQRRSELRALPAEEWRTMLGYAAGAAAITVSRAGANPPHRADLRTIH